MTTHPAIHRFCFVLLLSVLAAMPLCAETLPTIYYQPEVGFVGDPMPFYDQQTDDYKIYYLQEFRPNARGTYHPVYAISTQTLTDYNVWGEVLPTGDINAQDAAIGTGSVIYCDVDHLYYFYYTGNKYNIESEDDGQVVMCATSTDAIHWTKTNISIRPSTYYYYRYDFRDPEVFRTADGVYHMLVATGKDGQNVIAEFVSNDCRTWQDNGVFMSMLWDRFYECPNVFQMGDWWYIIYSEQHHYVRRVQYFKSRTYSGLRACTQGGQPIWPDDHEGFLDSRGLYAGKTAGHGMERYLWGWCPTRKNQNNTITTNMNGEPDWAGTMVAYRIIQHEDGSLTLGPIPAVEERFSRSVATAYETVSLSTGQQQEMETLGTMDHLSLTVTTAGNDDVFGILVCREPGYDKYYTLQVQAEANGKRKLNFLEEGVGAQGFVPDIDSYFFNRPADNTYHIHIFIENNVLVLYINDQLCYTNRIYNIHNNHWGLTCYSGSMVATDISHQQYELNPATAIVKSIKHQSKKKIIDGHLVIEHDNKFYDLLGNRYQ